MEQWTGSNLEKKYMKAIYCHSAYLTYMQIISCEMLAWMTQAGIKISGRNINNLDIQMIYHSNGRKCKGTKEPLDEGEKGE